MRKRLVAFALVGVVTAPLASTVEVEAGSDHGRGHSGHDHRSGRGKYVPIPPPEDGTFEACGLTLTVSTGDQYGVRERVTEKRNGTLFEYKGPMTDDIAASDGRTIDELVNSGYFSVFERADGAVIVDVHAPALIYPFSPEEAAAFAAAGLPPAFVFRNGTFGLTIRPDGTAVVTNRPRRVDDVCSLLM